MLPVLSPTWLLVLLSSNYFLSDICRKKSAYPELYNLYVSQNCPTEARTRSNHRNNCFGSRLSHIAVFVMIKIPKIINLQRLQIYKKYLTHIAATSLANTYNQISHQKCHFFIPQIYESISKYI